MSTRDLLIFTAVISAIIIGVTAVGWIYFIRWAKSEASSGRKQIDAHMAEVLKEAKKKRESSQRQE